MVMVPLTQPHSDKAAFRARMKEILAASLPAATAVARDAAGFLSRLPQYRAAQIILSYAALPDELDTSGIHEMLAADGKILALPRMEAGGSIAFYEISRFPPLAFQLIQNRYGIWEPDAACAPCRMNEDAALILVPGLAFTRDGRRLGRGKGCYDRFLAGKHITRVGCCFPFQLVDTLPTEAHDARMDVVLV